MSDRRDASLPPLMVFADDWGRHPSSCQHLVRRLQNDFRILWVNSIGTRTVQASSFTVRRMVEKLNNWRRGLQQVADQMWVLDVPMLPAVGSPLVRGVNERLIAWRLNRVLRQLQMTEPVVLTTLPYVLWMLADVPRHALIYNVTDDYSQWPHADRAALLAADREMATAADLVLPCSRALLASYAAAPRCEYFPHGVDYSHFAETQHVREIPPALAALPGPRIGFFGLIYEKLDFELLTRVARRFPQASLVMLGPVDYCPREFESLANVHFLGKQPYEQLPRWLAGLDVLLLPYKSTDAMIQQSNPLKARECLASGKPTVSIDLPEVRLLLPHVRIGATAEEFLAQIEAALDEPADSPAVAARQAAVADDRWERRAEQLREAILRVAADKLPAAAQIAGGHL